MSCPPINPSSVFSPLSPHLRGRDQGAGGAPSWLRVLREQRAPGLHSPSWFGSTSGSGRARLLLGCPCLGLCKSTWLTGKMQTAQRAALQASKLRAPPGLWAGCRIQHQYTPAKQWIQDRGPPGSREQPATHTPFPKESHGCQTAFPGGRCPSPANNSLTGSQSL